MSICVICVLFDNQAVYVITAPIFGLKFCIREDFGAIRANYS